MSKRKLLKEMSKEIGKDIEEIIKNVTITATYPILGNLSVKVKERIREHCHYFNPQAATVTTFITNMFAYPAIGGALADSISSGPQHYDAIVGSFITFGIIEMMARVYGSEPDNINRGSLIGKIITLPIEYLSDVYDR